MQHVGQAIDGHRRHAGVAEDDLVEALGRGVAVIGGLNVLGEQQAQRRGASPGTSSRCLAPWPRNQSPDPCALQLWRKARAIC